MGVRATKNSEDVAGKRFNSWTLVSKVDATYWLAKCDCGTERSVFIGSMRSGASRSCGCAPKVRRIPKISSDGAAQSNFFGELLRQLTSDRGVSVDLAAKLGASPHTLYNLWGAGWNPSPATVEAIADALGVDPAVRRALHEAAALDHGFRI